MIILEIVSQAIVSLNADNCVHHKKQFQNKKLLKCLKLLMKAIFYPQQMEAIEGSVETLCSIKSKTKTS